MLDIGTGTGLLSMLAVRAGAVEVYGCELYQPLAEIARDVTSLNCGDKIKASPYLCFAMLPILRIRCCRQPDGNPRPSFA